MDVTLQVIAFPPTHFLSPDKDAVRYKRGDVVQVIHPMLGGGTAPGTRMVFIHVTGVPAAAVEKAKRIMAPREDGSGNVVANRRFNIDPQALPAGVKATLDSDRGITVTWAQAKPYLTDKDTTAVIDDGVLL